MSVHPSPPTRTLVILLLLLGGSILAGPSKALLNFTYKTGGVTPVDGRIQSVDPFDWNHDGKTDLIVTYSWVVPGPGEYGTGKSAVDVLISRGDGTFQALRAYSADSGPLIARAGDGNGDGKPDLFVSMTYEGRWVFLSNRGDNTFQPSPIMEMGTPLARFMAVADLNRDGAADLILPEAEKPVLSNPSFYVLMSRGDGSFAPPVILSFDAIPHQVFTDDMNRDGSPDLIVEIYKSNSHPGAVSLFLNRGDGTFFPEKSFLTTGPIHLIGLNDFNRDGNQDVFAQSEQGTLLFWNDAEGNLSAPLAYRVPPLNYSNYFVGGVAVGDFDGNGTSELLLNQGERSIVVPSDPVNGFGREEATTEFILPSFFTSVAGDFDGDGRPDVAGFTPDWEIHGQITVYLNRKQITPPIRLSFAEPVLYDLSTSYNQIGLADFNGDGLDDFYGFLLDHTLRILHGKGDGTFDAPVDYTLGEGQWIATVADLNGDRKADLVLPKGAEQPLRVRLNDGDGEFAPADEYAAGAIATAVRIVDVNGDGRLDLISTNQWEQKETILTTLLNRGDGTFQDPVRHRAGGIYDSFVFQDVNDDGWADFRFEIPPGGSQGVLIGKGDGTFGPREDLVSDPERNDPNLTADFNSDGRLDYVVLRQKAYGENYLYLMLAQPDGTFQPSLVSYVGGTIEEPWSVTGAILARDFNGDGKSDLMVKGFLWLGKGDGTFAFQRISLPALLVGDFNRDGKPDLAGGSTGAPIWLNNTPDFSIVTDVPFAGSGKTVEIRLRSARSLEAPPRVTVSGPCIEEQSLALTAVPDENGYIGFYTAPDGSISCTALVRVEGKRTGDGGTAASLIPLELDRVPPTTTTEEDASVKNGYHFSDPTNVWFHTKDDLSQAVLTYYSIDQPDCSPAALASCKEVPILAGERTWDPIRVPGDGIHTVYYFSRDEAGNLEDRKSLILKINSSKPVVPDAAVTVEAGKPTEITLLGTDPGIGDPLQYRIESPPFKGRLGPIVGNKITYTPNPGAVGYDSFTVSASDGVLTSPRGRITITIRAADPPIGPCGEQPTGDVNGDGKVTLGDATLGLRASVGLLTLPSECSFKSADANKDGKLAVGDVILILRHVVLGTPFPAG